LTNDKGYLMTASIVTYLSFNEI